VEGRHRGETPADRRDPGEDRRRAVIGDEIGGQREPEQTGERQGKPDDAAPSGRSRAFAIVTPLSLFYGRRDSRSISEAC
jgi:hypothetical protein